MSDEPKDPNFANRFNAIREQIDFLEKKRRKTNIIVGAVFLVWLVLVATSFAYDLWRVYNGG